MFAKLPRDISERTVLLLDPMLATGKWMRWFFLGILKLNYIEYRG